MREEFDRKTTQESVVTPFDIEQYLTKFEYLKYRQYCASIWKIIDIERQKKYLSRQETIYISHRHISRKLKESGLKNIQPKLVCRCIKELTDTHLLEIVEYGKSGRRSRLSNGYRLRTPDGGEKWTGKE